MKYEIELSNADLIAMLADALSVDLSALCTGRKETIPTNIKVDQDGTEEADEETETGDESPKSSFASLTASQKYGMDRDLLYTMPIEVVSEKYGVTLEAIEERREKLAGQVDLHKVAALKKAGWKPKQIADEFVCSPEWIEYVLQVRGGKSEKGKKSKSERAK